MWDTFIGRLITHFISSDAEALIFMRAHAVNATAIHCAATRLRRRCIERFTIFNCFVDACVILRCACIILVFSETFEAFAIIGCGTESVFTTALCAIANWLVTVQTAIPFHTFFNAVAVAIYFDTIFSAMAIMRSTFVVHHVILVAFASVWFDTFAIFALNITDWFANV